jgi:hypothetical protein
VPVGKTATLAVTEERDVGSAVLLTNSPAGDLPCPEIAGGAPAQALASGPDFPTQNN